MISFIFIDTEIFNLLFELSSQDLMEEYTYWEIQKFVAYCLV